MTTDPFENAELARAERSVARLPRRRLLPPRGPASRLGRVLTVLAPVLAVATVAVEMRFSFAPTSVESVWAALVVLVAVTVPTCLAAGELGGRAGRASGIVSGVLIVPPVGIAIVVWCTELVRLLL